MTGLSKEDNWPVFSVQPVVMKLMLGFSWRLFKSNLLYFATLYLVTAIDLFYL